MRGAFAGLRGVLLVSLLLAGAPAPQPALAQYATVSGQLVQADEAYRRRDYQRAAQLLDELIAWRPADVPAHAYAKRCSIFLLRGEIQAGLAWISRVAETVHRGDPLVLEQKALLLVRAGHHEQAAAAAQAAIAGGNIAAHLHIMVGDYQLKFAGQPGAAAVAYRRFLATRPAALSGLDGLTRVKLGFAQARSGQHAAAEATLQQAIRSAPHPALADIAQQGLCESRAAQQRWALAVRACGAVVGRARSSGFLHQDSLLRLGRAHLHLGRATEALAVGRRLVQAAPNRPEGHILIGDVLRRRQAFAQAAAQYRKALDVAPEDFAALRALGLVYLEPVLGDPGTAVTYLTRAARLRPGERTLAYELARAHYAAGDYAGTIERCQAALDALAAGGSLRAAHQLLRGKAYFQSGQFEPALLSFEEAAGHPRHAAAARVGAVATLNRLAQARLAAADLDGAERLLVQARTLVAGDATTNLNLGIVYQKRGRHAAAAEALRARLQVRPRDGVAHRLLAKSLVALGEFGPARTSYAAALAGDLPPAMRLTTAAEHAMLAELTDEHDTAIAGFQRVLAAAPGGPLRDLVLRHLELAHCRRGLHHLRAGNSRAAAADLGRPRPARLLRDEEVHACDFGLAIAHLIQGRPRPARRILADQVTRARRQPHAGGPVDAQAAQLLLAYADILTGTPEGLVSARDLLVRMRSATTGDVRKQADALLLAAWERMALAAAREGRFKVAEDAMDQAARLATPAEQPRIQHNLAALSLMRGQVRRARRELEGLLESGPEALVNLGLIYEREGNPRQAYDSWLEARRRGLDAPEVLNWIETKRQLFGYDNAP